MRRFIIPLLMVITIGAKAQTLETTDKFPTGHITTSYYSEANTIKTIDGVLYMIYNDMPVALVKYPPMNTREEFEVPSTVRRICANAFQGTKFLKTLKLHSTVDGGKFLQLTIAETAFVDSSIENFVVIENDVAVIDGTTSATRSERREVARYDLSGLPTDTANGGIQIVQFDDNTSRKVTR